MHQKKTREGQGQGSSGVEWSGAEWIHFITWTMNADSSDLEDFDDRVVTLLTRLTTRSRTTPDPQKYRSSGRTKKR